MLSNLIQHLIDSGKQGEKVVFKGAFLCFSRLRKEFESDSMVLMSEIPDRVKKDEDVLLDFKKTAVETGNGDPVFTELNADRNSVSENWRKEHHGVDMNFFEKQPMDVVGDSDVPKESFSRKRKRQCYWCWSMLNWIRNIAKDPCNPAIGELPERNRWKFYGSELQWKQVISTRELMLSKMQVETSQHAVWQKKQKMHPSMYEDDQSSYQRIRSSRRILAAKDPSIKALVNPSSVSSSSGHGDEICSESDTDSAFWFIDHTRKRSRIGPQFQADLPKYCEEKDYTSDSKWLGTKVWPLDTSEQNKSCLIERDPIGKGRAVSCGCQFPGNPECVGFHIREKRMKSMLELRSAFYSWSLNNMGEYVALSWTKKDEKKFQNIVETNRLSSDKCFWDELFKSFPSKGRVTLVSYYFNVFLVRRRSEQNRSNTGDIYSDDEESEFGPIANRFGQPAAESKDSIFCSPKKTHPNTTK